MFMKTNELDDYFQDVDEKKGVTGNEGHETLPAGLLWLQPRSMIQRDPEGVFEGWLLGEHKRVG